MRYSRGAEHTNFAGFVKLKADSYKPPQATQRPDKGPFIHNSARPEKCRENSRKGPGKRPALLSAALWYAGRGIPVLPLHSVDEQGRCSCEGKQGCKPGKHPRIPKGHHGATTDTEQISRWWSRWPLANIGIPTGERSGLLVLDVDADKNGFTSLDALKEKHGPLPETRTVRTGGGGMHVYLDYPTESGIRNSAGQLGEGLDVRGEGGYVVAPPSRTDKGPYAFLDRLTRAAPPEWLLEAVREPFRAAGEKTNSETPTVSADLDGIPILDGSRNHELTRVGGKLRARGLELEGLEAELLAVNAARCTPPLEASEVAGIARSVCRYPAGDASPEPDPETLEAVERLFTGVLERLEWTGRRGPTKQALYKALLILALRHGRKVRGGVKVYVSTRQLAELAGTSNTTVVERGLPSLTEDGLVYRASEGRGAKAGALVLKLPQHLTTQPHGGGSTDSGQAVRDVLRELLRLRYGPGRAGKLRSLYLEVIARSGGATLSEISERTGRRRDNVRRSLEVLEARALVECSGDTYALVPEFAAALDNELEVSGIKEAERLQRARHARQREAYRDRISRRSFVRSIQREPEPDGYSEEVSGVEASVPEQPEQPDTEPSTVDKVSSVSEVFALARESFGLSEPEPSEPEPLPDNESPAVFLSAELRGVSGMRYREMLRRWKDLGGSPETLEGAIYAGSYRFKREPSDFNQPYVYPGLALIARGAA